MKQAQHGSKRTGTIFYRLLTWHQAGIKSASGVVRLSSEVGGAVAPGGLKRNFFLPSEETIAARAPSVGRGIRVGAAISQGHHVVVGC